MSTVSFNPYSAEGGIVDGEAETQRWSELPERHTAGDSKLASLPRSSSSSKRPVLFTKPSRFYFLGKSNKMHKPLAKIRKR